jgi:plasmid stabilization system protein ParE
MARILVTGPAKRDIQAAHDWWSENRSAEQASRWYVGIYAAMKSLRRNPQRCSVAMEAELLPQGLWQLLYGLGRRPTHRIVFTIDDNNVIVLRVRHVSQDALTADDIEG